MNTPRLDSDAESISETEDRAFWLVVAAVTIAFFWILLPFYGAVFWATIVAVLFAPVQRRLVRAWHGRRNLASLATLLLVLFVVILPLAWTGTMITQEAASLYQRVQSGEVQPGTWFPKILEALPSSISNLLERFGFGSLAQVQERAAEGLSRAVRFLLEQGVNIGQNTFEFVVSFFVMLYLLFFLLRDGERLARRIRLALPLQPEIKRQFVEKSTTVVRATVKGNVVVAVLQGALGGLAFWLLDVRGAVLWGVAMSVLSLLPAVGAALVWLPVALYLIATGGLWQGVGLIVFGVLVIGLVDNVVRPVLVGKDTKLPDYVALISTLGGIAVFGINGFVIGPVIAALFMAAWDVVAASREPLGLEPADHVDAPPEP
ncbi:MAG: AI-2E family transporter [Burkholderiaceae bacterium]|jgi:predicted PurR-regulated permease PerM|nr:AI-2E family transporter [Burkholderiaceae bacterium]